MTITLTRLVTALIPVSATEMHLAAYPTQIDAMSVTNTSGSDVNVSVWLTAGGAASNSSAVLISHTLAGNESYKVTSALGQVVAAGASIYAQATVADVVALVTSGRVQS